MERVPVDVDLARVQWSAHVVALEAAGWPTLEVAAAPESPESVFVEDTVVMYGDTAVITSPGAAQRKPE